MPGGESRGLSHEKIKSQESGGIPHRNGGGKKGLSDKKTDWYANVG